MGTKIGFISSFRDFNTLKDTQKQCQSSLLNKKSKTKSGFEQIKMELVLNGSL